MLATDKVKKEMEALLEATGKKLDAQIASIAKATFKKPIAKGDYAVAMKFVNAQLDAAEKVTRAEFAKLMKGSK